MSITAREVIADAYYLSAVCSRDFNVPTASQMASGLTILNDILSLPAIRNSIAPYYSKYDLTLDTEETEYEIDGLIAPETIIFLLGNVRIPINDMGRDAFFGGVRVVGVSAPPFSGRLERTLSGYTLHLYFIPDQEYEVEIWGKFGLSSANYETNLETFVPRGYIVWIKHKMAEYICNNNQVSIPEGVSRELSRLDRLIQNISAQDLRMNVFSSCNPYGSNNIDWNFVNFFKGYLP